MVAIARTGVTPLRPTGQVWQAIAEAVQHWAAAQAVNLRDAIVLVPLVQNLPAARQAFARLSGWQPRIETTQTLAVSLGPAEPPDPAQLRFDMALDRLAAARLLRRQGLLADARDAGSNDHLLGAFVQTAQSVAHALAALPPSEREHRAATGRAMLGAVHGPGGRERLLARLAFEWAAAAAWPNTDALFGLHPAAWVVVQSGGVDALAQALLRHASANAVASLLIDTDWEADAVAGCAAAAGVQVAVCVDFEDEAQQCAAQVLASLNAGDAPVALVAQDRLLVRRVRALLARAAVPMVDETGWRLSTTRAGASLAALLRAAAPRAGTDDWLDWLKSAPTADAALPTLETALRRRGWARTSEVIERDLPATAAALWRAAGQVIAALEPRRARSLDAWLDALRAALQAADRWLPLLADDAGRQLVAALHLGEGRAALTDDVMSFGAFGRWIDAVLETAPFRPAPDPEDAGAPRVVIVPLAQAMLRPFAAVVFPGADEKRLGAPATPQPLLGDALAVALGLPGMQALRAAEAQQFAQLLRCPRVTLLRRREDDGEPLAASPLIERLNLARLEARLPPLAAAPDERRHLHLPLQPVWPPLPAAPALLPEQLSASACEALRACPYRFFALHLLRLGASDELDDAVEKRDYGTWLHAVLNRFHRARGEGPRSADTDAEQLHAIAIDMRSEQALDDTTFLPYAASFARLVPAYVAWLQARDAAGAQWLDGEVALSARPAEWQGIAMRGRIDRVDSVPADDAAVGTLTELIDYKTGGAQNLARTVANAQEDTQLAFYAALMLRQSEATGGVSACYLPLDSGDAVQPIAHRDVEASAELLVAGLGRDLAQIRAGAPLPALGEGSACTHCDARGLCRRDHWAPR